MPEQAFHSLFAETENIRWDSMNQVRARARRRTIGQAAVVAGVVAVALVSGGVAVAQHRQPPVTPPAATASPTPPPSTPSSPASPSSPSSPSTSTVTDLTSAMMLQPRDVGSGYTVSGGDFTFDFDWTFEFGLSALGCSRSARPARVAERERELRKGQPQDETFVLQHTLLSTEAKVTKYLADVRTRVSACEPASGQSVRIAAQGFAGDDSVLVVFDHGAGNIAKTVLVRKGGVLTEIFSKPGRSDSASRELGRKAVARL
ncbi:hypothetical protein DMB66_21815 [Actinoplanes sp. ATCC 53533]|uniref:hypothetical protein n=1 Tax=Actinoplanes sp. ATCC 53533 TaxID=1288362 RepID=UPI000F76D681|nr:hypothetical protein [Actinoplanes sp. ATCC 53533]RSM63970.1 hypothetical protein DMB66_21815 [Actinoplanes sp. ATCC 53533]